MAKKKHKVSKTGPVWHQSSEEATLSRMPKYNGFACGSGVQGDTKYNRKKVKRQFMKELDSGSFYCFMGKNLRQVADQATKKSRSMPASNR